MNAETNNTRCTARETVRRVADKPAPGEIAHPVSCLHVNVADEVQLYLRRDYVQTCISLRAPVC
eukprot:4327368-Amphidinium_carterae.1